MAGVLRLPSGRLVRGRGLRPPLPAGPRPDFALYLLGHEPPPVPWETPGQRRFVTRFGKLDIVNDY
jgi:hypothetical protein